MSREQELREQIAALSSELWGIKEAKERKENEALVGKCYVYMNSAGSDTPEWPCYFKVTGLDEDGDLETFGFERDYRGCFQIDRNWSGALIPSSTEIPEERMTQAWVEVMEELGRRGKCLG